MGPRPVLQLKHVYVFQVLWQHSMQLEHEGKTYHTHTHDRTKAWGHQLRETPSLSMLASKEHTEHLQSLHS